MRLIDADAFERRVMFDSEIEDLQDVIYALRDYETTIDAVQVVRCKECKWFGDLGCAIRIVDDSDKPTENDYCSFAERRNE